MKETFRKPLIVAWKIATTAAVILLFGIWVSHLVGVKVSPEISQPVSVVLQWAALPVLTFIFMIPILLTVAIPAKLLRLPFWASALVVVVLSAWLSYQSIFHAAPASTPGELECSPSTPGIYSPC